MRSSIFLLAAATLGLGLPACGGGEREADVGKFTGTWHPTAGTLTVNCPGYAADTSPVTSNDVWSKGVSSDLVLAPPGTSCVIEADVTGSTAGGTSAPCTFTASDGSIVTETVTSYTFVVAPDGKTAQENATIMYVVNSGGATATCTGIGTASYQKIGA